MKLVSNKIVKVPRMRRSVARMLEQALQTAKQEWWSSVVIMGIGPDTGHSYWHASNGYEAVGLHQRAAKSIMDNEL